MWKLVMSQLERAKQAYLNGDAELAREIVSREKYVDVLELKIDRDCENYIALYNPVAIDLRLVLSLMKISRTLERIGDFAEGIARHVVEGSIRKMPPHLQEELQVERMFSTLLGMLSDSFVMLESENTKLAGKILRKDDEVDAIYSTSMSLIEKILAENAELIPCGLRTLLLVRKLERIGDHCSNIVEEIVFYVDAKVLKHKAKFPKNILTFARQSASFCL